MKARLFLILFAVCLFTACGRQTESKTTVSYENPKVKSTGETLTTTEIINDEIEDNEMIRRMFTVIEISDYFYLKDNSDRVIKLDLSYVGDFKIGDWALIGYQDMTENDDGTFSADIKFMLKDEPSKPQASF